MPTLKAFQVYPGESPLDSGSLLVFAETNPKARYLGVSGWPGLDAEYTDMKARRRPKLDHYALRYGKPATFDSNRELPEWMEPVWDNCLTCSELALGEHSLMFLK